MILRGKRKTAVHRIAAEEWNAVNQEVDSGPIHRIAAEEIGSGAIDVDPAVRAEAAILRARRRIFAMHGSEEFGSIWTTILISLAIRLAVKLIMQWMEEKVFSVEVPHE